MNLDLKGVLALYDQTYNFKKTNGDMGKTISTYYYS